MRCSVSRAVLSFVYSALVSEQRLPGARERARAEVTAAITQAARRRLAEDGAAALSLRAVARDLGMVSSALYRYVPSRDDLLTALIVDAYEAIGDAAEQAEQQARRAGKHAGPTWLAICRAVRRWAVDHPHEWALVYGSPVPGYRAPEATVEPAARLPQLMAPLLREAAWVGELDLPAKPLAPPRLVTPEVGALAGEVGPGYEDVVERALVAWTTLVGTISFELFGHLHNVVTDYDAFFDAAMTVAADSVGLDVREPEGLPPVRG